MSGEAGRSDGGEEVVVVMPWKHTEPGRPVASALHLVNPRCPYRISISRVYEELWNYLGLPKDIEDIDKAVPIEKSVGESSLYLPDGICISREHAVLLYKKSRKLDFREKTQCHR